MNTKLRVAAYCRVSKDIKEQETSFITQTTTYDRIISMHPEWELIKIYADKGKTGTSTKKRFEFNQMIEDAKSGKIDLILVKSVSRFSRNTVDLLEAIRALRQNGVGVYFEKENINTLNLNSELLITVFAAFAQEESFSISENMRKGIRQRFKLGIPKISQLYGYDNLSRNKLTVNKEKALIVKRIFNMYIDGYSTIDIANILNKEKIAPPIETGKLWYPNSVKCILQNEKYAGNSLMQKYYTANYLEHDSTPNRNNAVKQYYKENTHPAIVSKETFDDANRIMQMHNCKRGINQYPFYGKLICPYCGKPMVKINTGQGKLPYSWVCQGEDRSDIYSERISCPFYQIKDQLLTFKLINILKNYDSTISNINYSILKKYIISITFTNNNCLLIALTSNETLTISFPLNSTINSTILNTKIISQNNHIPMVKKGTNESN